MALVVQTFGIVGTLTAATIAVRSYLISNKRAEEARKRELETRQVQLFMRLYQSLRTRSFQRCIRNMESSLYVVLMQLDQ